ncbi:MAG: hypothetical protein ACFB0G_13970 [Leptolyngbyaceae cyanobacterium]
MPMGSSIFRRFWKWLVNDDRDSYDPYSIPENKNPESSAEIPGNFSDNETKAQHPEDAGHAFGRTLQQIENVAWEFLIDIRSTLYAEEAEKIDLQQKLESEQKKSDGCHRRLSTLGNDKPQIKRVFENRYFIHKEMINLYKSLLEIKQSKINGIKIVISDTACLHNGLKYKLESLQLCSYLIDQRLNSPDGVDETSRFNQKELEEFNARLQIIQNKKGRIIEEYNGHLRSWITRLKILSQLPNFDSENWSEFDDDIWTQFTN